jgi:flagellar M-ring protein FliF
MIGREQLERLWSSLLGLGARRLTALGIVGLSVFAAVALGSYYLSRPEFETLYSGLNPQDVSRIGAALKEAGIAFDVDTQGTKVMVRPQQTAQARMLLAEKGLPSSATGGYELFDKLGSIGLTSFMQEITRVRALEGELARTIQAMNGIRAARVHIVLQESGSFRRGRQQPSASVVIRTDRPDAATAAQAIRHLVSAAVPGMTTEQVQVLSTDGTVLATGGDSATAVPGKMVELERTVNKELQDNIRKVLAPYLGLDNFEISVAARLNMDKRQINETSFDPESRAERSLRVVRETGSSQNTNSRASVSVEQNLPSEQAPAASGDQSKRSNERREELRNYELSSKTVSTISEGYKIENLAVAVVVNRKRLAAALGEGATADAIDKQMSEIQRLVESAVGLDAKRGDKVTVSAKDFLTDGPAEEGSSGPSIAQQLVQQLGAVVKALTILGATFLLIWFGLRPTMRMLLNQPAPASVATDEPLAVEGPTASEAPASSQRPRVVHDGEPEPNLIADLTSKLGRTPQKRLEQMIDYDEEQAAAILKQWMRGAKSA